MIDFSLDPNSTADEIEDALVQIDTTLNHLPADGERYTPSEIKLANELAQYQDYLLWILEEFECMMDQEF